MSTHGSNLHHMGYDTQAEVDADYIDVDVASFEDVPDEDACCGCPSGLGAEPVAWNGKRFHSKKCLEAWQDRGCR